MIKCSKCVYFGININVNIKFLITRWFVFRIDAIQMTFVIVGACMGALGLMILIVGCLATGATRRKVYRAWRSRVGGRISCAVVSFIKLFFQICTFTAFVVVYVSYVYTANCMDINVLLFDHNNVCIHNILEYV